MLSDDILALSTAFGERFFLESALLALENDCLHEATRDVLKKVITLHMMSYLNENMGWYLKNKFVTLQAARDLHSKQGSCVKALMPHINDCVSAMGVPTSSHLGAPISRDYIAFNGQRNTDNFESAGDYFDYKKGATRESQYRPRM